MNKPLRHTFKRHDMLVSSDDLHPNLSGRAINEMARLFAPDREAVRGMLVKLRHHWRWSEDFAAAVLGFPTVTLRKWENGERNPSGAARKLIWFLYDTLSGSPRRVGNVWDLAVWGVTERLRPPNEPFALAPTATMTRELFHQQVREAFADESGENVVSVGEEPIQQGDGQNQRPTSACG